MHRRRIAGIAGAVAVVLVTARAGTPAHAAPTSNEATMANEILTYANAERQARGLPTLTLDTSYGAGAQGVAEQNSRNNTPNQHTNPATRPAPAEILYTADNAGSSETVRGWMRSPGHRNILMSPKATRIGIGVACHGVDYESAAWLDGDQPTTPDSPVVTPVNSGTHCDGSSTHGAPTAPPTTARRTPPTARPAPMVTQPPLTTTTTVAPTTTVVVETTTTTTGADTTVKLAAPARTDGDDSRPYGAAAIALVGLGAALAGLLRARRRAGGG
ncbi:MAG TPA: CAP domain-containing protein [Acidimicrobiales bacterium]|nr:CAP domain-containing protein [Acidimicrobiales bacterium]